MKRPQKRSHPARTNQQTDRQSKREKERENVSHSHVLCAHVTPSPYILPHLPHPTFCPLTPVCLFFAALVEARRRLPDRDDASRVGKESPPPHRLASSPQQRSVFKERRAEERRAEERRALPAPPHELEQQARESIPRPLVSHEPILTPFPPPHVHKKDASFFHIFYLR